MNINAGYIASLIACSLAGSALADDACRGPWPTSADLTVLAPDARSAEVKRLIDCTLEGVADLNQRTTAIGGLDIAALVSAPAERDSIKRLADDLQARIALLEPALAARTKERDEAVAAARSLKQDAEHARRTIQTLEKVAAERDEMVAQREAELAARKADLERQNDKASALAASGAALDARLLALQTERTGLQDLIVGITRKLEARDQTVAELQRQASDAGTLAAGLKDELAAAGARIAEVESQIEAGRRQTNDLQADLDGAEKGRNEALAALAAAQSETVALDRQIRLLDSEKTALTRDLAETGKALASLRADFATSAAALAETTAERDRLRTETKSRRIALANLEEKAASLGAALEASDANLTRLGQEAATYRAERDNARGELNAAAQKIPPLESRVASLTTALSALEADLQATTTANETLRKLRSEFLAKLSARLTKYSNIKVQGDRFIIETEVLFALGSADLNEAGQAQIHMVATLLKEIAPEVPPDLNWVLQVNGHTDVRKLIPGGRFASNWDLSTARATSVVKLLQADGVPPKNLAAAGFGEHQPIDAGTSEEAFRRNRRIELKITDQGAGPT